MRSVLLSGVLLLVSATASGDRLSADQFIKRAKSVVESGLRDPSSVQYRDVGLYLDIDGKERALCGEFNAKNLYGGYVGFKRFWVEANGTLRIEGDAEGETPASLYGTLRMAVCDKLLKAVK